MDNDNLSALCLGIGVGIAVGVLFAPKPGVDTRRMLKNALDDGTDYLQRRGDDIRRTASEMVERGKDSVEHKKDQHFQGRARDTHSLVEEHEQV